MPDMSVTEETHMVVLCLLLVMLALITLEQILSVRLTVVKLLFPLL